MLNDEKNKIDINILIALTNIIDDYEEFHNNLISFIGGNKYNRDLLTKLKKLSQENNNLVNSKIKKFYINNKKVIDTINKYTSIYTFVASNYNYHGDPFNDYDKIDYYYNYLKKNKDNIEQIKLLLERIKALGFKEIDLNESYDFTDNNYYFILDWYKHGNKKKYFSNLNYMENIEVIPNYEKNTIEYCTKDSNYRIMINEFGEDNNSIFYNKIMVNNLLFSPDVLPKKISQEETLDKIICLKNKNIQEDNYVREAVHLSSSIDDLERQFVKTNRVISKLESVQNKKELQKLLIEIFENIQKLRDEENLHYQQIIQNNNKITENNLNREKRLYLERKHYLDVD